MNPIKKLEELLNMFDGVQAYDSSDGNKDELAFIFVSYGNDIKSPNIYEMVTLAQCLVDTIKKVSKAKAIRFLGMETRISMEWMGRSYPTIIVEMPQDRIRDIVSVLSYMPKRFFCSKVDKQAYHYQLKKHI